MILEPETPNSLQMCNAILSPVEQDSINKAARFAFAGRHMHAENTRKAAWYHREACIDVDKIGRVT